MPTKTSKGIGGRNAGGWHRSQPEIKADAAGSRVPTGLPSLGNAQSRALSQWTPSESPNFWSLACSSKSGSKRSHSRANLIGNTSTARTSTDLFCVLGYTLFA